MWCLSNSVTLFTFSNSVKEKGALKSRIEIGPVHREVNLKIGKKNYAYNEKMGSSEDSETAT